jgi:anaerobic magnesium-protoporphyrin IX monomethyl ester cyclase
VPDVLLINPPYCRRHGGGVVPPIGLCYLAASLREIGAKPEILDLALLFPEYSLKHADLPVRALREYLDTCACPPRLIGIGPLVSATLRATRDLLEACRAQTDAVLAVGGALCAAPGMSSVIGSYLDADAYVVGDGETPLKTIWRSVADGRAVPHDPGIGLRTGAEPAPHREDVLDALPLPARDLLSDQYRASARRTISVQRVTAAFLSRGCPYACTFCAAPLASGRRVRRLSGTRISSELSSCAELGYNNIIFYDDCLFVRSRNLNERVLEFCEAIERSTWRGTYQLEFRCDAVVALSDDAMGALIRTGCRQVNMGIEKAHVAQLNLLQKRLSPAIAREACERVNASGIRAAGTFIIGGVGETRTEVEQTIAFAVSLPLAFAHFNPLAVYPGTVLYGQVFPKQPPNDWLSLCLDEELSPMGDILWRSDELPLSAILELVEVAYREFYSRERLAVLSRKLPVEEMSFVDSTYRLLARERARSWSNISEQTVVIQDDSLSAVPGPC